MVKRLVIVFLVLAAVGAGTWYYMSHAGHTQIEKILSSPKEFEGKEVSIEGEVTDRTSFFGVIKFFKVRDKTGEIIVFTKKSPPQVKSMVSVKGKIDESFSVGDQKFVVFVEESVEAQAPVQRAQ